MRIYNARSAFVTVEFEPEDVARFAAQWPCFDGPEDGVSFEFDTRNGDLVDMSPSDWDGPAALAMSQDAREHFQAHKDDDPEPPEPPASPASWDRFDICEAWSLLAHDFGLYGIVDRLGRMGFRPRSSLAWDTLSPNAQAIYSQGERTARDTGRWSRRIGDRP